MLVPVKKIEGKAYTAYCKYRQQNSQDDFNFLLKDKSDEARYYRLMLSIERRRGAPPVSSVIKYIKSNSVAQLALAAYYCLESRDKTGHPLHKV